MFPMTREKGFEFEAFECVLIDGWDLSVKIFLCLKQDLEALKDIWLRNFNRAKENSMIDCRLWSYT